MNGLPTECPDRKAVRFRMIEMTPESREETERVLNALEEGIRTGMEATGGHWNRPVE